MAGNIVEALQSIFTSNVLLLLGSLWAVLVSSFLETRYSDQNYSGILTGVSNILFGLGLIQLVFPSNSPNQLFSIVVFVVLGVAYLLVHFEFNYFDIDEDEFSLIFAGRQSGALQLSFIIAFIFNRPDMFAYFLPLVLLLNGFSFIVRYVKNHFSEEELPWGVVGVLGFLMGAYWLSGLI